jgi:hypothetical protein
MLRLNMNAMHKKIAASEHSGPTKPLLQFLFNAEKDADYFLNFCATCSIGRSWPWRTLSPYMKRSRSPFDK